MDGGAGPGYGGGPTLHQQLSSRVVSDLMERPSLVQIGDAEGLRSLDHGTLILDAVLYVISRIGLASASAGYALEGATREEVQTYMVGRIEAQASWFGLAVGRPAADAYAQRTLDRLLNHGGQRIDRTYRPFGGTSVFTYRLLEERFGADGRTAIVRATEVAANALLNSLSFDVTDVNAAVRLMIQHHLGHGNYDRMSTYLGGQYNVAMAFDAQLSAALSRVFYQIRRTSWSDLESTVEDVRRESREAIEQDEKLRKGLIDALHEAAEDDRERIRDLDRLGSRAFRKHAEISGKAVTLHEEFIRRKSTVGLRPPPRTNMRDFESDILLPLLGAPADVFGDRSFDLLEMLGTMSAPSSADPVHWIGRLLSIRKAEPDPSSADPDSDYAEEIQSDEDNLFDADDELRVDDLLLTYGKEADGPFCLSEFLLRLEEAGETERILYLACLFATRIFLEKSRRWSVSADEDADPPDRPIVDDDGLLRGPDGEPLLFRSHRDAARFVADLSLGHAVEPEADATREDVLLLRANGKYPTVRPLGGGRVATTSVICTDFRLELLDPEAPNYEDSEEDQDDIDDR
ncbi:hypothetical protein [Caenispirillum salinarum]|uniref:hypothetical protein n=1 Tax=Caenispirillum salinarum TaxID=859058 RepID=UPI00384DEF4E